MDADERLTGLKKAYADIILNTAKEAAARIMVSERKALRFEYELKNAKEDALQMLMRLKQMMDFKVNEAAMTSCTQQKKIEELEAQLQEAEDIVKDLREELRAVESELEKFPQHKQVKHTIQVDNASIENTLRTPSEVQPASNINQTNQSQRLYNSFFPLKKSLIGNGDLPSIILRSKETELYRNGCTQRIRACERTPHDKKLIAKEDEVVEKLHKTPSIGNDDIMCNTEDKEVILDITADNSCLTSPSSVKHTSEEISDKDLVKSCNSESMIIEETMPMRQEKDVETRVDQVNTLTSKSIEVPSQPLTDRVIKYTFQRKRKRGALIDKSDSNEKSENANLIGESTPEKIHLEQVARQLISLSDKKW